MMFRQQWQRWMGWSLMLVMVLVGAIATHSRPDGLGLAASAQAQSPRPTVSASPQVAPTTVPTPSLTTPPTAIPPVPVAPAIPSGQPAPPASTAAPADLGGTYTDPAKRFQVGILKNFKVSPLSGTVLMESPNGNLAYTVVVQSQPLGTPIGLVAGYDNSESLAKVATNAFQRGEGFQPGPPRMEAGNGAVMDWTGTLTIGGTAQPMRGVILVRPSTQNILLLLVAATQTGEAQVPGAIAALAPSLKPVQ